MILKITWIIIQAQILLKQYKTLFNFTIHLLSANQVGHQWSINKSNHHQPLKNLWSTHSVNRRAHQLRHDVN